MKQLRQDVQKYNQAYMQVVTFVEQVKVKKKIVFVSNNSAQVQIIAKKARLSMYERSHSQNFEASSLNYLQWSTFDTMNWIMVSNLFSVLIYRDLMR